MNTHKEVYRCAWVDARDELMVLYHDTEWGIPLHDDKKLFEFLVLDTFQAGLSWKTILHKRKNFARAFSNGNAKKVAQYTDQQCSALMQDAGIIRNRLKIWGTVKNAKAFLQIQKEWGSFDAYIWSFTKGRVINNKISSLNDIPTHSDISDAMSRDMKKRGFTFVGTTICYAFMQAMGMVNDHEKTCFCRKGIGK